MKRQLHKFFILALCALLFFQCTIPTKDIAVTTKFQVSDPFQQTMTQSQEFTFEGKTDNTIEGKNGTVVVLPKGCFVDAGGKTVKTSIKLELTEALSLNEMVLSNLTTTAGDKLLETGGMIYINATANGEQLFIDKDNPIYIEIPTDVREPGMSVYQGVRDENGNMDWISPRELESFLLTVDIDDLDFYPAGFEKTVAEGLPFRNHTDLSSTLVDSLYYSLSLGYQGKFENLIEEDFDINEPYYEQNNEQQRRSNSDTLTVAKRPSPRTDSVSCGIDPAIIKTIKTEDYQNTLLATREFEARLQHIFDTRRNDILEIYIHNLDKNLWELDSMAFIALEQHPYFQEFERFSHQKLGKVKDGDKYAQLLSGHYKRKLAENKEALETARTKVLKELAQKNRMVKELVAEYKDLLKKREKVRMETYGFIQTTTGWVNIDRGTNPKSWESGKLDVFVVNGKEFDRVHTYVFYTSIKSLYRLNSTDQEDFYVGNSSEREMLMPKEGFAQLISIGYIGESAYLATDITKTFYQQRTELKLHQVNETELAEAINVFDFSARNVENRIEKDLEYMAKFAIEKKRQQKLQSEADFIARLLEKAFPCWKHNIEA